MRLFACAGRAPPSNARSPLAARAPRRALSSLADNATRNGAETNLAGLEKQNAVRGGGRAGRGGLPARRARARAARLALGRRCSRTRRRRPPPTHRARARPPPSSLSHARGSLAPPRPLPAPQADYFLALAQELRNEARRDDVRQLAGLRMKVSLDAQVSD